MKSLKNWFSALCLSAFGMVVASPLYAALPTTIDTSDLEAFAIVVVGAVLTVSLIIAAIALVKRVRN